MGSRHADSQYKHVAALWHSGRGGGVSPNDWLILTDLHGVITQKAGIYIGIAVATPYLR
jgi:hypothetical protein